MALGVPEGDEPTGGIPVDTTPPPARPTVIDEGVEFETVWFPHKNAASLLGDEVSRPSTITRPALTLRELLERDDS